MNPFKLIPLVGAFGLFLVSSNASAGVAALVCTAKITQAEGPRVEVLIDCNDPQGLTLRTFSKWNPTSTVVYYSDHPEHNQKRTFFVSEHTQGATRLHIHPNSERTNPID